MGTGAHDYRSTGVHMYEDLITLHYYFTHVIIRSVVGRSETHSDSVSHCFNILQGDRCGGRDSGDILNIQS